MGFQERNINSNTANKAVSCLAFKQVHFSKCHKSGLKACWAHKALTVLALIREWTSYGDTAKCI